MLDIIGCRTLCAAILKQAVIDAKKPGMIEEIENTNTNQDRKLANAKKTLRKEARTFLLGPFARRMAEFVAPGISYETMLLNAGILPPGYTWSVSKIIREPKDE